MTLKTPEYDLSNHSEVYEPSEDTFLFIDALEREIPYLKSLKPQIIAEVGSGSGVVITSLMQVYGTSCFYLTTDINREACIVTKNTGKLNNGQVEACEMDLLHSFRDNMFDIILFNPPYVVTDADEIYGRGLNRAWAGGSEGRSATDKLLKDLPRLLIPGGVFYCLLLKENKVEDVAKAMQGANFSSVMVLQRKIPGEHLYVYKFVKHK